MAFLFDEKLRAKLVSHLSKVVGDTPFEQSPFPHILVRGFLPEDVYSELLQRLPSPGIYEPFEYEKRQIEGRSTRFRFQMDNAWLDKLSGATRTFWYTIRSALGGEELKQAIYAKLAPGLSFRYSVPAAEVNDLSGFARPELFHETEGYMIKPHPDTRRKVVTMQIALTEDDSQRDLGTEFYRRSLNPLSFMREPRGFDLDRRMPFTRNTAYAFVVLNKLSLKSWHGRTSIPGQFGVRNSLLNIWYDKAEDGNPEVAEERRVLNSHSPATVRMTASRTPSAA